MNRFMREQKVVTLLPQGAVRNAVMAAVQFNVIHGAKRFVRLRWRGGRLLSIFVEGFEGLSLEQEHMDVVGALIVARLDPPAEGRAGWTWTASERP